MMDYRTGIGYDIHKLKLGIPLMIGGIQIPYSKGLAGHSDGDVLLHAIVDAILGGMAEGDIGTYFSDRDSKWKNASSKLFIKHAWKIAQKKGFTIQFVDCIIIAEKPKFSPHFKEIRKSLADLLSIPLSRVSVKAKTQEKIGEIGKGKAIAAMAVSTLQKFSRPLALS
jgi:2-C-methyl-D-erythritol 2,4-cyclodiphosphate synthase